MFGLRHITRHASTHPMLTKETIIIAITLRQRYIPESVLLFW